MTLLPSYEPARLNNPVRGVSLAGCVSAGLLIPVRHRNHPQLVTAVGVNLAPAMLHLCGWLASRGLSIKTPIPIGGFQPMGTGKIRCTHCASRQFYFLKSESSDTEKVYQCRKCGSKFEIPNLLDNYFKNE
jgi:DNA-directed RNA polymerase subunit RPC12/RpoP